MLKRLGLFVATGRETTVAPKTKLKTLLRDQTEETFGPDRTVFTLSFVSRTTKSTTQTTQTTTQATQATRLSSAFDAKDSVYGLVVIYDFAHKRFCLLYFVIVCCSLS